jgi:hypothetical protein
VSNIIKCEWLVYTLINHQGSGRWQKSPSDGFIQNVLAILNAGTSNQTWWQNKVWLQEQNDSIMSLPCWMELIPLQMTSECEVIPFSVLSTGEHAGLVSLTMWGDINQMSLWKISTILSILLGCQNLDLGLHSSHICEQKMPGFNNHHICLIFLKRKRVKNCNVSGLCGGASVNTWKCCSVREEDGRDWGPARKALVIVNGPFWQKYRDSNNLHGYRLVSQWWHFYGRTVCTKFMAQWDTR